MRKKTVLRIIIFALIIIWMLLIFRLSNQNGEASSSLSKTVASIIVSSENVDKVEPYVRKIAHLSEYAIRGNVAFIIIFNLSIL